MNPWICPVCGEVNGPFQTGCIRGPHARTEVANTTHQLSCLHCYCKFADSTTSEHAGYVCCKCGDKRHTGTWS